ncbi:MAG: exopolysaccharide transport family protein [Pseudomonadota bacterium]
MAGAETLLRDDEMDLTGIFYAIRRRLFLILLLVLATGFGLFFFLSTLDSKYQSSVRILVKDGNNAFTRVTGDANQPQVGPQFDEQTIRSEVEIAGSNRLIQTVINKLQLNQNPDFLKYLDSEPTEEPGGEQQSQLLEIFNERLTVYAVEQSRVIVIEFWAHSPKLARDVAQAMAETYISFKRDTKLNNQSSATNWLDPRIAELETAVSKKEAAVANYRSNQDLLRSDGNDALLATQQLSQVSTELSRLKAQRSEAQAKVATVKTALRNGSSTEVIPEVIESGLIQRLNEREIALRAQITDLSTTLLPNHPRMKSLQSQLTNLQAQTRSAAKNIIISLEGNVAAIREAETDLSKEIIRLKSEASRVDEKLVKLRSLEREAETARDLLAEYKSRSLEAKSREGLTTRDAEIISPATFASEAYFPKVVPLTIAGMVSAAVLSCLLIVAANLLTMASSTNANSARKSARQKENEDSELVQPENERNDGLQNTSMSAPLKEKSGVVGETDKSSILAVRHLAKALSDRGYGRIAVVSPGGIKASKTSTILARKLSLFGHSTVVIEFVEGSPVALEMLGRRDLPGVFNIVSGSVPAEQAIFKDRKSSVNVVPAGSFFPGSKPPMPEAISDVVDEIADHFDFCILDCGDAEIEDVNIISDNDTAAVISCLNIRESSFRRLERAYQDDGYEDVILLKPDAKDSEVKAVNARKAA